MILRPPRSTLSAPLFPSTTLFRSLPCPASGPLSTRELTRFSARPCPGQFAQIRVTLSPMSAALGCLRHQSLTAQSVLIEFALGRVAWPFLRFALRWWLLAAHFPRSRLIGRTVYRPVWRWTRTWPL